MANSKKTNKHSKAELVQWQRLPLSVKIIMSCERIRRWIDEYGEDGVYVAFSGGKDSTVLLDLVRNVCGYTNVSAMFMDTPTQYPELRDFAKTFDNVDIIKPKYTFAEVCSMHGFPVISKEAADCIDGAKKYAKEIVKNLGGTGTLTEIITNNADAVEDLLSKRLASRGGGQNLRLAKVLGWLSTDKNNPIQHDLTKENTSLYGYGKYRFLLDAPFDVSAKCCDLMKKNPSHIYEKMTGKKPILGTMASESRLREQTWIQSGCNNFDGKHPSSQPMAFWTENDVLQYIYERNLRLCPVYGSVVPRRREQVFEKGKMVGDYTEYETTGCDRTGCMLCGFGAHAEGHPNRFERIKKTHPKMYALLDTIKSNGVSYREALEWINENSKENIRF